MAVLSEVGVWTVRSGSVDRNIREFPFLDDLSQKLRKAVVLV